MAELKHTPGPWGIYSDSPTTSVYCDDSAGSRVADCDGETVLLSQEEKEANAKLIAASPDMLAFLQKMVNYSTIPWIEKEAQAIIDKATK